MAAYSSILAWEIPKREDPGGLQSMGLQSDANEQLSTQTCIIYQISEAYTSNKNEGNGLV